MNFINWSYHLDKLRNFYNSDFYQVCCQDENVVSELYDSYMSTIGDELACQEICDVYYGEDSDFWIDYLIEDFISYGYAFVPNIVKNNKDIPDIASVLDYQHGVRLETEKELYNFITTGALPDRQSEYIKSIYAIRRNSG